MQEVKEKYETDASVSDTPVSAGDGERAGTAELHRTLKGRHMQIIAIGGSIGSGNALSSGGLGALIIDFMIIGVMLLLTIKCYGRVCWQAIPSGNILMQS
ncbi:uncharacterized protein BP5553_03327 [Venustampulla echinocandica]|uniref:Amino acid permease/ SLC12A domain-containing protein n=1 Tax=Venustampulla echinocandica TaxID=2656787 RepID=A0A370TTX7_9HELO|nr:uncharacterized protein BP5553_03327 [Venustampulla echinocandica]RDL38987.1 hypothetical protein BP5553_03327 [Venustampulla echinocandica]